MIANGPRLDLRGAEQAALIGALRAEVAALRRQAGRDSSNSSGPRARMPGGEGEGQPAGGAAGAAGPAAGRAERPSGCEPGVDRPAG